MMTVIYNQPLAQRFGVTLVEFLKSDEWDTLDVAVAWVRRSGTRHLLPSLREFLEGPRMARFTVGVDITNTSAEGLEDLLSLEGTGDCRTFIHHNESSAVFHPKVYLFANSKKASLIVGSNNITESGLFRNTEVGLQIDAVPNAKVITDIRSAFDSWQDTTEGLARRLDESLLKELVDEGYVVSEKALRKQFRESKRTAIAGRPPRRLFGSKTMTAPIPPEGSVEIAESEADSPAPPLGGIRIVGSFKVRGHRHTLTITNVLLMRLRTARGGKQVQLPIPLRESAFFAHQHAIISGRDGEQRAISATHPERSGGTVNTYKVEMPEAEKMANPVARFERTDRGIIFYVYDSQSAQGRPILDALEEGRNDEPPTTVLTKPSDPEHCNWYRFV